MTSEPRSAYVCFDGYGGCLLADQICFLRDHINNNKLANITIINYKIYKYNLTIFIMTIL